MLGKLTGNCVAAAQKFASFAMPAFGRAGPMLPMWLRLPKLRSFNFILLHYLYMIIMTLIGSIILYPGGGSAGPLKYIDALFFAAGAATQSGLNTVDLNQLFLYQQIVLVLMACLCNPIVINTFVVFVRLYWFEKRFQGVVAQARAMRSGRTMSRLKSEEKANGDLDHVERGVAGRQIAVLHDSLEDMGQESKEDGRDSESSETQNEQGAAGSGFNSSEPNTHKEETANVQAFTRDITFADEIPTQTHEGIIGNEDRVPEQRTKEDHIAFVEYQRNPKDTSALWIPGPRDVERGYRPQRVQEGDTSDRDSDEIRHVGRTNSSETAKKSEDKTMKQLLTSRIPGLRSEEDEGPSSTGLRSRLVTRTRTFGRALSHDRHESDPLPYLSYAPTIGRNSTFVDLTEEQREELGGIEYRALKTLAWVLIIYYFGFFALGFVIMVPWITQTETYVSVVEKVAITPVWWGFFTPMSMFTDLGFTLTPDSMISFQKATVPLLLGTFLIIIGNTGFPCMLRACIWLASKCAPHGGGVWEELRFLLDHPRRCFTLLFPRKATWWLFAILVILNGLDLIFFVILDLNDKTVTDLPGFFQFLDGLFQAASTRTAGFACVNLADLHPAIQVSYLVMMYISIFPIAISIRNTNVYEEKSLGVYGSSEEDDTVDRNSTSYIGSHLRRQLSFDLWYVFLGLFLITIIEGRRIENVSEPAFTIFSVLFEVVSAYGTVGLSLGYPGINASFSTEFKTLSKLVIIAMMLRGRHRGLPYALDRAILLPSESLQRKEAAMAASAEQRREERLGQATGALRAPSAAADGSTLPPRIGELDAKTNATRITMTGQGLKRIVTGVFRAGPPAKHHHH